MYEVNKKVLREVKTQMHIINNLIDKLIFIDDILEERNQIEQLNILKFIYEELLQNIDDDLFSDLKEEAYTVICDRIKNIFKNNEIVMEYIENNPDDWIEDIFEKLGI